MNISSVALAAVIACSCCSFAHATDWPHWRGPFYNGTTDETGLPAQIDPATDLAWTAPMPGKSSATPIISGDAVFVVSNDDAQQQVLGLCLDRATGQTRWQKVLGGMAVVRNMNDTASCSPTTDGKTVYFLCGTGALYAFDFAGNEIWKKDLAADYGHISPQFGYTSSPLVLDGRIYLPLLHGQWDEELKQADFTDKDSHLLCLDAATGAEIWKHHRPSDARGESYDSYASMVPFTSAGVEALLVQGGDYLSAHKREDGSELWRHGHNARKSINWRVIPTPVVAGDLAIGMEPRGGDVFAVLPGEKTQLAYEEAHWISPGPTSDAPSAAVQDGKIFIATGTKGNLACFEVKTGQKLWEGDLETSGRVWGSPTLADGKAYCLDDEGQVTIASVTDGFKVLSHVSFPSKIVKSTIAIANGQLFVRTTENLYCIGKPKA